MAPLPLFKKTTPLSLLKRPLHFKDRSTPTFKKITPLQLLKRLLHFHFLKDRSTST